MKFIRVKVKNLRIESEDLLHKLIDGSFNLQVTVPLPDIMQKKISETTTQLNNYDVLSFNEFGFNSLSLYNFRVDEGTYAQYVTSVMRFEISEHHVEGLLSMTKLLTAPDFKLEVTVALEQTNTQVK